MTLSKRCRPPNVYWLPKIHKKDIILRPIVSSRDAGMHGVAKELSNIIRLLVGQSPHNIRNTQDFLNHIKAIRQGEGWCFTSYDVKALLTSVPMEPATSIIRQRSEQDMKLHLRKSISVQHVITLMELCLKTSISSSKQVLWAGTWGSHAISH